MTPEGVECRMYLDSKVVLAVEDVFAGTLGECSCFS
jgi:hypothetical protein